MYFFCPIISSLIKALNASRRSFTCSFVIPDTLPTNSKYSSAVRKSMRKELSMKAPVSSFQSSLFAGSISSGTAVGSAIDCCKSAASICLLGIIMTLPSVAFAKSSIKRNNVVLPAPLLPTSPNTSPSLMVNCRMSTAVCSPKHFLRLLSCIRIFFVANLMIF